MVTNLSSFYKINLFNELSSHISIFVVFTGDRQITRNTDFTSGQIGFEHCFIKSTTCLGKVVEIIGILCNYRYDELILGGWNLLPMWAAAFFSPKRKNSIMVESSILESTVKGPKGLVKRLFLKRVSNVYASGHLQKQLTDALGFKGTTVITKGVGVFNVVAQPEFRPKTEIRNFLYVGRLTAVKNLKFLISAFNTLPQYRLNIIGFGEQEEELKELALQNTQFYGAVDNKLLPAYYRANDVFVLPSSSEPWGLVVEEALNNGLPVLVSNRVGCIGEVVKEGQNGLVFENDNLQSLIAAIEKIADPTEYNPMAQIISLMDFKVTEQQQVSCYY